MGYMGSYYDIPKAIFYLLKGECRVWGGQGLGFRVQVRAGLRPSQLREFIYLDPPSILYSGLRTHYIGALSPQLTY